MGLYERSTIRPFLFGMGKPNLLYLTLFGVISLFCTEVVSLEKIEIISGNL